MINKNIIALGLVSFFTDMASSMITTILPIYIVYILHGGVDKLGFILGIATFISYAFRILFGYLSDKYQITKPFIMIGYTISALTKPLLYFTSTWGSIATLRGIERVGKAVRSASKDSLLSHYSSKKHTGQTFGFHKMMDIGGEFIGAILVFLALFYLGKDIEVFKNIFAYSVIPGLLSVIVVIFFVQDKPYKKTNQTSYKLQDDYKILPLLFIYFGFIFFMFDASFYIIKAKESGYDIVYIPLLVILLNFIQTITSYAFGLKVDTLGATTVLKFSFLFGIVSLLLLYFNLIILSFIFLGLFLVSSINSLRAYISNNATNKATVYGFLYAGVAMSTTLGAIAIGLIWQHFNENFAIYFSLSGALVLLIFLVFLNIKQEKNNLKVL